MQILRLLVSRLSELVEIVFRTKGTKSRTFCKGTSIEVVRWEILVGIEQTVKSRYRHTGNLEKKKRHNQPVSVAKSII